MNDAKDIISRFDAEVIRSLTADCHADGRSLGIALSGGADSVALLLSMVRNGLRPVALHCNFNLRGDESDGDEDFCRRICRDLGVEIRVASFDTVGGKHPGESLEMACRRLRYDWFGEMASQRGLDAVAIAHHREDSVETMLLNMLRGSGPQGMKGMDAVNGIFIRPLLSLTRADIEAYLSALGIGYRTDSTNLTNDYRRNALRNLIIPQILKAFPAADKGMINTMNAMRHSANMIADQISSLQSRFVSGDAINIASLKKSVSDPEGALYMLLRNVFPDGCSMPTVKEILKESPLSDRRFSTLSGVTISLSRGILSPLDEIDDQIYDLPIPDGIATPVAINAEIITASEFRASPKTPDSAFFDLDQLPSAPLRLRHWRQGDRLKPFGMNGSRKISDIFTDLKFTPDQKRRVWLLTCGDNILWVVGIRASRLCRVTDKTRKILKLTII